MRISETFKFINRQVSLAIFLLVLAAAAGAHQMAVVRLDMTEGRLPLMDAANQTRIQFIGYVQTHRWIVLPYAAVVSACLIWLQFRKAPLWICCLAFSLLALPSLGYMWVCLRVAMAFLRLRSLE